MSGENLQPIIIKKITKRKKEHHGGAWKIAYADFVTAMMAFFMLLWLLSLLNKYQLQGVSAYFQKPLSDIFVGSKNAENFKNQSKDKAKEVKNELGGKVKADTSNTVDKATIEESPEPVKNHTKKDENSAKEKESKQVNGEQKNKQETNNVNYQMEKLKRQFEISLQNNSKLTAFKDNLTFEIVDDGLKISLHDSENNQMFSLGKADFQHYARNIIMWLSTEFNKVPKKIAIIGHTDEYQYDVLAKYTNWELSTDRANVVRHLLILDGMKPDKIIRVSGAGDTNLQDKKNGKSPINRRVEIIILRNKAAKKMMN